VIRDGQIVLFAFPQTDQTVGKLRPALVLRRVPGPHDDWLLCMISSQLGCEMLTCEVPFLPSRAGIANDSDRRRERVLLGR
jgi:hypothetical protein